MKIRGRRDAIAFVCAVTNKWCDCVCLWSGKNEAESVSERRKREIVDEASFCVAHSCWHP